MRRETHLGEVDEMLRLLRDLRPEGGAVIGAERVAEHLKTMRDAGVRRGAKERGW